MLRSFIISLAILCCSVQVFAEDFNQDQFGFLANQAEEYYPSKLDSTVIYANDLIDKIRNQGVVSAYEEQMLDLLGRTYRRMGNSQRSEEYFLEAIELSRQRENIAQLGDSYNRIGLLYRGIGRYEDALESYEKSLEFKLQTGNENSAAGTLNNMGNLYRAMGERQKAYDSFIQSIEIRKRIGEEERAATAYLNLGNWMADEAEYEKALDLYNDYLNLVSSLNDTLSMASVFNNIGNVYNATGELEKALDGYLEGDFLLKASGVKDDLEGRLNLNIGFVLYKLGKANEAIDYYREAAKLFIDFDIRESYGNAWQNIGLVFEQLEQADSALYYYELAINAFEPLGNKELLAGVYENIGVIYNQESTPEYALDYLLRASAIFEDTKNERALANLYNNIGESYFYLEQYNSAISYFRESLEKATETDFLEVQERASFGLAETYAEINDFENAFKYQLLYDEYKDSLLNLERVKVIEELITRYETEQKDAEIQILTAEQAQSEAVIRQREAENRVQLIAIISLISATIGIILWFLYSSRKKKIILKQKELLFRNEIDSLMEKQRTESIAAMLKGQDKERKRLAAEVHDRLGSILSLVKLYFSSVDNDLKEKQPELYHSFQEGNQLLDDTFIELRAIIKEMSEGKVSGKGLEQDILDLLAKIKKVGVEIESKIELSKNLHADVETNMYRVIQEALSNSLKYSKADTIQLSINDVNELTLSVKDNGIGFDQESYRVRKEAGINSYGVENMENRVKLLGGSFSLKTKKGEGVQLEVSIPIREKSEFWNLTELN
ncbi:MAG: tetratricopeptide repeat protein [Balneolales bacterium]|nr:tetratricopeptide repeat protein [Balneolales bacterium]